MYYTLVLNFLLFWFSDVYYQHGKSQRNKACKTCSVFGLNVLGFPYWNQQSSRVSKSLVRCNSRIYNWNIYSSIFGKCVFVTFFFFFKYQYVSLYLLAHVGRLDFSEKCLWGVGIFFNCQFPQTYLRTLRNVKSKKRIDQIIYFDSLTNQTKEFHSLIFFYIKPHIKLVHIS